MSHWNSRNDANVGLINGGYPHPLLNLKNRKPELRISEGDFLKWRQEQQRRAAEKRREQHKHYEADDEEDVNGNDYDENIGDDGHEVDYGDELFKKHKANKANSAALKKKHKNHNYTPDYESSNSEKVYANVPTRKSSKKSSRPIRPSQRNPQDDSKKFQVYGASSVDSNADPTAIDPTYYSTLPKNAALSSQDDIYSGLMSKKYNKNIADKSKLLADINYSRKQQTKNSLQKRRGQ